MKKLGLFISLIALAGCVPSPESEPALSTINCLIVRDEPLPPVCPGTLGSGTMSTDITVRFATPTGHVSLASGGDCFLPTGEIILPQSGQVFALEIVEGGIKRRAAVTVPPSPDNIAASETQFSILTNDEHPATTVTWDALSGYSFALKLEVLDPNPVPIPFVGITGGKFQKELSALQISPSVALFNTDFAYYGLHKMTVFSLDGQYASLFDYLPQFTGSALGQGPSSFDRGPGIFGAVGKTEIYFEILP